MGKSSSNGSSQSTYITLLIIRKLRYPTIDFLGPNQMFNPVEIAYKPIHKPPIHVTPLRGFEMRIAKISCFCKNIAQLISSAFYFRIWILIDCICNSPQCPSFDEDLGRCDCETCSKCTLNTTPRYYQYCSRTPYHIRSNYCTPPIFVTLKYFCFRAPSPRKANIIFVKHYSYR